MAPWRHGTPLPDRLRLELVQEQIQVSKEEATGGDVLGPERCLFGIRCRTFSGAGEDGDALFMWARRAERPSKVDPWISRDARF